MKSYSHERKGSTTVTSRGRVDRRKTFGQVNDGGIETKKSQREGNREG